MKKMLSLRQELMRINLISIGVAFALMLIVITLKEVTDFRSYIMSSVTTQATIIGNNSTAALSFSDQKAASEILSSLKSVPDIVSAGIYTKEGALLASYENRAGVAAIPPDPPEYGYRFEGSFFKLCRPINFPDEFIGAIYIIYDIKSFYASLVLYLALLLCIMLISIVSAHLLFSRLQETIMKPIFGLVEEMSSISKTQDYSRRMSLYREGEMGILTKGFNEMLEQIEIRDAELKRELAERKQKEVALREREQFIRNILDSVDEGFIVIDRGFRILTANKAYSTQYRDRCDDVIGRHCYEISHHTNRPCYEEGEKCPVQQVFATGNPSAALHRHRDAQGNILHVEIKAYPIKDASGTITSAIETIINITERHLLAEERQKTQKLESIGLLAGGIAHDFNNLLQGIFGYISMAKMFVGQTEKSFALLEQAENALHQSIGLTTQLLTFSKGGEPLKERLSLPPVIENAAKFGLSGSRSRCKIDIEPGLWQIYADSGQVGQVIQNLVLNADQAMPEGGLIIITAKNMLSPDKKLPDLLREGKYVEISVQDSGIGIPEKYLQKIFDPYFTTKEKGNGLGLATSYSIIRNHGGVIDVASEVGRGTTFYMYLPAIEGETAAYEPPATSYRARKGKILVMDDDGLIQDMAEKMIRSLGHEAEIAAHGEAAIEKFRAALESGRPFDLVILDLTIRGGMGGRATVERLRAIDPGVRAIVSSGYSADAVMADYEKYGFRARLAKPYTVVELRDALNKILSQ